MSDQPRQWTSAPPPEIGRKVSSPTDSFRAEAIAHTGEWAALETFDKQATASALASRVRNGHSVWAGHVWGARVCPDGERFAVWVQHVGPATTRAVREVEAVRSAADAAPEVTMTIEVTDDVSHRLAEAGTALAAIQPPADPVDMGDADPETDAPAPADMGPQPAAGPDPVDSVVVPGSFVPNTPAPDPLDPLADPFGLPMAVQSPVSR